MIKIKQALVLGLTTTLLAIPSFAADNTADTMDANQKQQASTTPAKKEHGNRLADNSLGTKKVEEAANLGMSTSTSNEPAVND